MVVRWSDASFIEDQDQWWHAGHLPRGLLYATGATHIADVFARAELDDDYRDGTLSVAATVGGPGAGRVARGAPARSARADGPGRAARAEPPKLRVPAAAPVVGGGPGALHPRRHARRGGGRASPAASASAASRYAMGGCS